MSSWSRSSFWAVTIATLVVAGGLSAYFAKIGLAKANALSGVLIVILSVLILGGTILLVAKREGGKRNEGAGDASKATEANPLPTKVEQQARGHGRNYFAGRDMRIGSDEDEA